jgi:hypothetical protein
MDRKQQVSALPIDAQERAAIGTILYERAPALDKRIARGDDFAGDAWVRWVAVGHRPDPLEAHAANAYPKLVTVLRTMNHMGGDERGGYCICPRNDGSAPDSKHSSGCAGVRALLRELGEIE